MWPNPQETEDLATFTEEILNGNLYFLCSVLFYATYYEQRKILMNANFLYSQR